MGEGLLHGKSVVVVGVGPGLGSEVVRAGLAEGAQVLAVARNGERLAAALQALDPGGEQARALSCDVSSAEAESVLGAAVADWEAVDGVAIVAALDNVHGQSLDTPDESWRAAFEVNVLGAIRVLRAVRDRLRPGSSIVLTGSQSMWRPQLPQAAYAASKGALTSTMYSLATELGPSGVRVNMVVPTWMWGPPVAAYCNWQAGRRGIDPSEVRAELAAQMPLREVPGDEDVAQTFVFLLSDRASRISGQTVMVNSGEFLR